MGKGSRRRPCKGDAYQHNYDEISWTGQADLGSGTFVFRGGKLVPGRVRQNDAHNMVSVAAGVMPDGVDEARRRFAEDGLTGTKVREDGNLVFRDRQAKLAHLKVAGLHDKQEVRG